MAGMFRRESFARIVPDVIERLALPERKSVKRGNQAMSGYAARPFLRTLVTSAHFDVKALLVSSLT